MRFLGIDYGSKRVGIAMSDEEGKFAMPVTVLQNNKKLTDEIVRIAEENNIKEMVMGESKDYKGNLNPIYEDSLKQKRELEDRGYIVYFEPEFMTSVGAQRFQGNTELLDASAAALILQSFLDKRNKI